VLADGWLFVSGQLPIEPDGTARNMMAFADQADLAIANALAVVRAAGKLPASAIAERRAPLSRGPLASTGRRDRSFLCPNCISRS
jgi:hypothetical protein